MAHGTVSQGSSPSSAVGLIGLFALISFILCGALLLDAPVKAIHSMGSLWQALPGVFLSGIEMMFALLYSAKRGELRMSGVANPSEEAIKEAVTKEEMARHCRRRTRGVEATSRLIESLLTTMSTATDALGVPLFRDDMVETIWPEQRRHLPCIQDPPESHCTP